MAVDSCKSCKIYIYAPIRSFFTPTIIRIDSPRELWKLINRPMQSGSCTHIIANGGLSGTKTQKWINGQGSRGLAKRMKVVTTDCKYLLPIFASDDIE